jgi:hypothetical protein
MGCLGKNPTCRGCRPRVRPGTKLANWRRLRPEEYRAKYRNDVGRSVDVHVLAGASASPFAARRACHPEGVGAHRHRSLLTAFYPGRDPDRKLRWERTPSTDSSRSFGQKSEKWHLSRDESANSSRRYGQNSTKMGCVRGARNESGNSSRSFGQKSEKWHLSRDESGNSSRR